jgi:3-phenylpropionate/trans-cinnamate dioxygenase ferredoxin reductase subunit
MQGGVVIIGAGQAGAQVATSLRDAGHTGAIRVVGDEVHLPYQRPPLSKAFLKEAIAEERLHLRPRDFYGDRGIDLVLGHRVVRLDVRNRRLELTGRTDIAFDTLVLATGTRARLPRLPGADLANVFALRSIADVEALRPALAGIARVAIVGGGYIGLEVAAVLREKGKEVLIIEAEDRPLKRVTSATVSHYFTQLHRENGVEFLTGARIAGIEGEKLVAGVRLTCGRLVAADAVLLAVGAIPNTELAETAGLAVQDGVLVDIFGRTSAAGVYACGDCARFPSRRYDRSVRIESVQNAIDQAKCVAATIAGAPAAHDPVPWFWSDQYRTKLQIAGLFDPTDHETVVGEPGSGPFSVEYRRAGRLVAVDAIDNARAHMLARRRIAEETAA